MSTSDRRSSSSGPSKARRSVFVSTTQRDREHKKALRAQGRSKDAPGAAAEISPARRRAEERKAERESRQAGSRRAFRVRAILAVVVVLAVVGSCVGIYSSPLFAVTHVEVAGVTHLTADRVRQLAAVPAGATLLRFPSDAVAARVAKDPWVGSVSVSRVFPDGMRIRVTERAPVAVVDTGKGYWFVDPQSYLLAPSAKDATATLPVIRSVPELQLVAGRSSSPELRNAVAVLTGLSPQLAATIRIMLAPTIDGTSVITSDRVEIVFGQAIDMGVKDAGARRILTEQRGKAVSIDVRNIDRMTWRGVK